MLGRSWKLRRAGALVLALLLLASAGAAAAIRDHPLPSPNAGLGDYFWQRSIVSWNGALWFTERNVNKLGRIDTSGRITELALPAAAGDPGDGPEQIAAGSDGLWFISAVGRFVAVLGTDMRLSYVEVPALAGVGSIAAERDRSGVWLGDYLGDGVMHTTREGTRTIDATFERPAALARGPDGAIWLGDDDGGALQRITSAGAVRAFPLPRPCRPSLGCTLPGVTALATGPDRRLWYTRSGQRTITRGPYAGFNRASAAVGRMAPNGRAREWDLPNPKLAPHALVAGPDRALWFATADGLGRVDTRGRVKLMELPGGRTANSIAFGPDRALWFTDDRLNRVSRITIRDALALAPRRGADRPRSRRRP